jgi:hypothetical protein
LTLLHTRCDTVIAAQREEIAYLRAELEKAHTRIACMIDPMLEARRATAFRVKVAAEAEAAGVKEPAKKSAILPHSASAVSRLRGLGAVMNPDKSPEEVEEMFVVKSTADQSA